MSPAKIEGDKKRGFIVPIGGAEDKEGAANILRKFIEVSGGKSARIVIIPTASTLEDTGRRYEKLFRKLGADEAKSLPFTSRDDAGKGEWLEYIEKANGIFVTGGNQLRLTTILGGTAVAKAIRRANARGVAVGGTSAGAAILSEHMIAYGAEGHTPQAGAVTLVPGLRPHEPHHHRPALPAARPPRPPADGARLQPLRRRHRPRRGHRGLHRSHDEARRSSAPARSPSSTPPSSRTPPSPSTKEGKPVCMTNVRLHVLVDGGTFDLETRRPSPAPR